MIESGELAIVIAHLLMVASAISAVALGIAYGSVEVPARHGGSTSSEVVLWIWAVFIGAGLNGVFFGYVLLMLGRTLVFLGETALDPNASE